MTTTKQYDFLNRLTRIESAAGSSNVSVSAYQYNLASQRTALTNADSSYWIYTYDPLGQVTSGKKYWSNGTPVAGQQFEYGFDDIGNRQSAASGGNATGANLREQSYSANLLNQYTSRTVPGYVDVLGKAASAATVTVWGDQSIAKLPLGTVGPVRAERQGDYWRAEVPINNSTGAVWLTVTNWAVLNQGTNADLLSSLTGSVLVAQSPESFTYDLDGNLTSDSLWTNIWNGENRRVTVESAAGVASSARAREQWTFLPDGRWIERIVSTNNGSAYYPSYTNRYVWDGNVLLAVLDHTNGLCLSFTRGLDLSGTPQGAGGAGGLVFVGHRTSAVAYHAAAFDGNGNVTALVSMSDSTTSAEYAYGPFGEPIQATGPMAKANPLRFSTQYADEVTGDLNYLFRAYTARTGRWPSRDPLGEAKSENLYVHTGNLPTRRIDTFGLAQYDYAEFTPSGSFEVRLADIDYNRRDMLQGFQAKYLLATNPPCPCKKKYIVLVQVVDPPNYNPSFDNDRVKRGANVPIPTYYQNWDGNSDLARDPLIVNDAPLHSNNENIDATWSFEDCAVCRRTLSDGTVVDRVLGCVKFDFIRKGGKTELRVTQGGQTLSGARSYTVTAESPGTLWKKALEDWNRR